MTKPPDVLWCSLAAEVGRSRISGSKVEFG